MSDPMNNTDIDDVLSSIRRLVSDHPSAPAPTTPPRLVLTPALRVDDGPQGAATRPPGGAAIPDRAPAPQPDPGRATSGGWIAAGARADTGAPDPDDDGMSLEERIAELEQAIAASAGEWEPDGSEEGAGTLPQDMPPVIGAARDARAREHDAAVGDRADDDMADRPTMDRDVPDEADDTARLALVYDRDDDALLDEETLRDLVAEFVRQELQGALGERITRNVRKLVRAEIQRALAARDFG